MKHTLKTIAAILALVLLVSCSDFFDPENGTVKYGDDYMNEGSELYSGFVGVITKMQAIGDKAILLTDTRGELLEPTGNSPELYAIYNYEPDLSGNSYADPAGYYDLIIACNDYLEKAREFRAKRPTAIDEDHYRGLISNIIRLKVWTYFTLGKIYGQAVWFDDPMWELKDYKQYPVKNLDEIISTCVEFLRTGFDYVDGTHNMSWTEWITNSNDDTVSSGDFEFWDVMVPPYWVLAADLALWQERWQDVVDLILPEMNAAFEAADRGLVQIKYMCNTGYASNGGYPRIYDAASNNYNIASFATVSVIRYNYLKDQTNSLIKHFRANDYKLKPSQVGMDRYLDPAFNPNNKTTDVRFNNTFREVATDEWVFSKYRKSGADLYRDDNHIYTYHSSELYFMLIEAFNHLGRYDEMEALMNKGLGNTFSAGKTVTWEGFTQYWAKTLPTGTREHPDLGIRGPFNLPDREFKPCDSFLNKMHNDLEILKEIVIALPGEGKTYPAMIRMAKRYNDYNIIADIVCPKYEEAGKAGEVRSKILDGAYFVPWDLDKASTH